MIIGFKTFVTNTDENLKYKGDIERLNSINKSAIIKKINKIDGNIHFKKDNDILIVNFDLIADIDVESSYSLDVFNLNKKINDTVYFFDSSKKIDCDNTNNNVYELYENGDLDELIYSLLVISIPINIHKEGEELPSGEGFKVYSEDELLDELENETDSPFEQLKDLDL